MHHSVAAIRAGHLRARFATHNSHRGERHLGLRRSSQPPLSEASTRRPAARPVDALRYATRSLAGARRRDRTSAVSHLRRPGTVNWSSRAHAGRLARPRSAAPWRG